MISKVLSIATLIATLATAFQAVASMYSDRVLADGPLAYYRLDETTGTLANNLGTGGDPLDGTYIGYGTAPEGTGSINIGQAGPRPGNPSGAGFIDGLETDNHAIHSDINFTSFPTAGENPRVAVPDFAGNPLDIAGALTLEAWIFRDPQTDGFDGNNEGIIAKFQFTDAQRAYTLLIRPTLNQLRFITSASGAAESANDFPSPEGILPIGKWTHVAATYIPSVRSALFVNGKMVAQRLGPVGVPDHLFNSSAPLWIGVQSSITNALNVFEGKIDEAAIYNKALSDATILEHYQAGIVPEPTSIGLVFVAVAALVTQRKPRRIGCRTAQV